GRQSIPLGDPRLARGAASERAALGEQLGPRGAMNRAVHAAAAEQRRVGGVDDGVDGLLSDVALDSFDVRHAVTLPSPRLRLPGLSTSWHRSPTNPIVKCETNGRRVRGACGPLALSGARHDNPRPDR